MNKRDREVVVVADDFTGANDAGVSLALCGKTVSVAFSLPFPSPTAALVINTDSRALTSAEAADRIRRLPAEIAGTRWLIKKIDSTLRGNVGAETAALQALSGRRQVIVAPACPSAGRTTQHGRCLVHGVPVNETEFASDPKTPVTEAAVAARFPDSVATVVTADTLEAALVQGAELLIVDATRDDELDAVIATAHRCPQMPLLVGSAGLCDALARHLAPVKRRPVLAVVGSMSEMAQRQIALAAAAPGVTTLLIDVEAVVQGTTTDYLCQAIAALQAGRHCILYTCPDHAARHQIARICQQHQLSRAALGDLLCTFLGELTRQILRACPPAALYVSGGDVAIAVARALGAQGFAITGRVAQCVPYGRFLGCHWRRPVMTKAGGFGKDETLLEVLHFIEEKMSDDEHCGNHG